MMETLESLCQENRGILIDGISSLLWIQVQAFRAGRAAVARDCRELVALIDRYRQLRCLVVVDCDCAFPEQRSDFWFNAAMRDSHSLLSRRADRHRVSVFTG